MRLLSFTLACATLWMVSSAESADAPTMDEFRVNASEPATSASTSVLDSFRLGKELQLANTEPAKYRIEISNGLQLLFAEDSRVQRLQTGGKDLSNKTDYASGFFLRDAAAASAFVTPLLKLQQNGQEIIADGGSDQLHCDLHAVFNASPAGIQVKGWIQDTSGKDRAISVYYALPISSSNLIWHDDVRTSKPVASAGDTALLQNVNAGATGTYSLYPLCAVTNDTAGISLAAPIDRPAIYRFGYSADAQMLYVAFDFGLSEHTKNSPRRAEFSFTISALNPQWGFRSALENYYKNYPDCFIKNAKQEGIWLAKADPTKIEHPEDFNFMFHQVMNGPKLQDMIKFDDEHGFLTYRYILGPEYGIPLKKDEPQTYENLLSHIEAEKKTKGGAQARAVENCGLRTPDGKLSYKFMDWPWLTGFQIIQNTDPKLPQTPEAPNRAHINYNPEDPEKLFIKSKLGDLGAGLDGHMLDSLGMYSSFVNYSPMHFSYSSYPLTFDRDKHIPCMLEIWSLTEFCKWISEDLHSKGKMVLANGLPGPFPFLAPYADMLGREVSFLNKKTNTYSPESDATLNYRRAICYQKPLLMLWNDNYNVITHEMVEMYMKRGIFYGFYPSMFEYHVKTDYGKYEHPWYFNEPKFYNRDRDLFKKYVPMIRTLSQAGWEPVPYASCEDKEIWVERFGSIAKGNLHLTVLNTGKTKREVKVVLDDNLQWNGSSSGVTDLVNQKMISLSGKTLSFELEPENVVALSLK